MAAFKNPEFYAKLGMRLPTFNIPRIISCSEIVDDYLWLPRGCEESVFDFFNENGVSLTIEDKNNPGQSIDATFIGKLRYEQAAAIEELSKYQCGTIYAATAFGKTVTGIAMIARKKVNTLILVHTKALLDQWRERLAQYLEVDFEPEEQPKRRGRRKKFKKFGALSSTENSLNGKIDIALLQSCISDNEVKPFVRDYGMVIVDECHHAPAVSFERVLKDVNAKWVYGLTATPIRKDGHQPIIFMQCGEIRYTADSKTQQEQQTFHRLLIPRFTTYRNISDDNGYTAIAQSLSEDDTRNQLILDDVRKVLGEGRSPIVLTGLTSHVDYLAEECRKICPNVIRLVGNDSAKAKRQEMERLKSIPNTEPLVVVATGKYVGEGFDLPRLDTLMLVLPVSWKGLIAQYTGRLHRDYPGKSEVRIYDYIDLRVPICDSMYKKRLHGYKAVGY
ncbi:DEAD/DEAH box helicase, partial [uncultured Duncaniella sp.]